MSTLRFRMGMAEAENASLRGNIKTMEAIETVTRSQERKALMEMERQLASVQESQRQDRENFRNIYVAWNKVAIHTFNNEGIVELFFVGTEYQLAELFTKPLPEDRFKYLVRQL
ncbi:hypothetical protein Tco_0299419, partial [Tanacetum coccineum]